MPTRRQFVQNRSFSRKRQPYHPKDKDINRNNGKYSRLSTVVQETNEGISFKRMCGVAALEK